MPLIEAALAFAITMLALSLVCSSFVELVHRIFSMRQAGLRYMLEQMFDQVLKKYVFSPEYIAAADAATAGTPTDDQKAAAKDIADARAAFVGRMSANRAPMGATRKATPTDSADAVTPKKGWALSLWGGRDLSSLTTAQFMERLGSMNDIGPKITRANADVNTVANVAAGSADAVLKDVAQKFEAFGSEAADYFEGRARLLSVLVAVTLAFATHVDAVDLFRTYLRDPNARAKVIEQSQAVTAQYKAAQEAMDALAKIDPLAKPSTEDVKTKIESLQKDSLAAIAKANATVGQYADLGLPLGWTDARLDEAKMWLLVWTCTKLDDNVEPILWTLRQTCRSDEADNSAKGDQEKHYTKYREVWLEVPTVPRVWVYLFLGGLLIGLGSPFWYDVVTGLTNLRGSAGGAPATTGPGQKAAAAAPADAVVAGNAQPITPVGAFQISSVASKATT